MNEKLLAFDAIMKDTNRSFAERWLVAYNIDLETFGEWSRWQLDLSLSHYEVETECESTVAPLTS